MNAAQTAKYFFEWGRARDYFLGRGLSHALADAKRHELHRKALGLDKSSKEFSNADLDAVLAVFRAVWDGGNLDAQLRQLDMPERRAANAVQRIQSLKLSLGLKPGLESGYVQGIARNLFGVTDGQWQKLDAVQLAQLEGVIMRRLRQLHSAEKVERLRDEAVEAAARAAGIVKQVVPRPAVELAQGGSEEGNPF